MSKPFVVHPPEESKHRPYDTYDVETSDGGVVLDNMPFEMAKSLARRLNEAFEDFIRMDKPWY